MDMQGLLWKIKPLHSPFAASFWGLPHSKAALHCMIKRKHETQRLPNCTCVLRQQLHDDLILQIRGSNFSLLLLFYFGGMLREADVLEKDEMMSWSCRRVQSVPHQNSYSTIDFSRKCITMTTVQLSVPTSGSRMEHGNKPLLCLLTL